jgi:antitoxin (DNA-binding transcriptional repressor) of toxin-antitoxin stability system
MRAVGLKVLKNKLSEYVRLAASGERILVTDRDMVVAELVPPDASRSTDVHDALRADAVRTGIVSLPLSRSLKPPPRRPVMTSAQLAALLDEGRANR